MNYPEHILFYTSNYIPRGAYQLSLDIPVKSPSLRNMAVKTNKQANMKKMAV